MGKIIRKGYHFLRRKVKRVRLFCLNLKVEGKYYLKKRKFKKKVAIVSSLALQNKIKEDVLLKRELMKLHIQTTIIAWEDDKVDYDQFDLIIIRTIWGYQKKIMAFNKWLEMLDKKKIRVVNNLNLIYDNFNKSKQFKILKRNGIPYVETDFLWAKDIDASLEKIIGDKLKYKGELVIKPIISASGNNTFVVSNDTGRKNTISLEEIDDKYKKILKEDGNGLMVQPFIKDVDKGEYSLIYINHRLSHAILRNAGIFNNNYGVFEVNIKKLDQDVLSLGEKISNIKEYDDYLYMRIDIIRHDAKYEVLEVELLDPCLFFDCIKSKQEKIEKIGYMAQCIKEKISK